MPLGQVRITTGVSANVAAMGFADALGNSRDASANAEGDAARSRANLITAAIGPGVAPVVSARAGLGAQYEGGVSYTGRAVRADVRRSMNLFPHWALSAGLGGSAVLGGHDAVDAGYDLGRLRGAGADIPVLVGYESDGGLYAAWLGVRGGWDEVFDPSQNAAAKSRAKRTSTVTTAHSTHGRIISPWAPGSSTFKPMK